MKDKEKEREILKKRGEQREISVWKTNNEKNFNGLSFEDRKRNSMGVGVKETEL